MHASHLLMNLINLLQLRRKHRTATLKSDSTFFVAERVHGEVASSKRPCARCAVRLGFFTFAFGGEGVELR
jgi:hypothetical protein